MRHSEADTIAAIATAPGRGGIGVIRVSGTQVQQIAAALLGGVPPPRHATIRNFLDADGNVLDTGLVLYFAAPTSFTGEDVLELQGHGGPVVLDMLLARLVSLGARLAQPGEFSRRAFLNDKINLLQAEAIADLIASESVQAARAAVRSLQGEFAARIETLHNAITETRMHVEAAIDFPEEEIDFLADQVLQQRLVTALALTQATLTAARQGALLRQGMTVVIAGKPNAGKSSLMNKLAGYEAAIVTATPGTTRDVLRERIQIDGMPIHVLDTAGLRDSRDVIEAEGIRRARDVMQQADRILYLLDATCSHTEDDIAAELTQLPTDIPVTLIFNKIDLSKHSVCFETGPKPRVFLSAHTGHGFELLRQHLKDVMGFHGAETNTFSARRRHLDALQHAAEHLQSAQTHLHHRAAGELAAEELRLAQYCLGEITGEVTADDLLGKIFSTFCIGK